MDKRIDSIEDLADLMMAHYDKINPEEIYGAMYQRIYDEIDSLSHDGVMLAPEVSPDILERIVREHVLVLIHRLHAFSEQVGYTFNYEYVGNMLDQIVAITLLTVLDNVNDAYTHMIVDTPYSA